ncbi:MAG: hypothetical protein U1A27_09825 [Phycisphaerae bacterium]
MSKRGLIVLLVGLNMVLATTLVLISGGLPAAYAQAAPLAANYLMVSGVIQQSHDALYIIDLANRDLHVFEVDRTTRRLFHRDVRDLLQDFRGGR